MVLGNVGTTNPTGAEMCPHGVAGLTHCVLSAETEGSTPSGDTKCRMPKGLHGKNDVSSNFVGMLHGTVAEWQSRLAVNQVAVRPTGVRIPLVPPLAECRMGVHPPKTGCPQGLLLIHFCRLNFYGSEVERIGLLSAGEKEPCPLDFIEGPVILPVGRMPEERSVGSTPLKTIGERSRLRW